MTLKVRWIDSGREPQNPPDPDYPRGREIDLTDGAKVACFTELPYPAKRCGRFIVACEDCGYIAIITTAGRIDDPRSVKIPCKPRGAG